MEKNAISCMDICLQIISSLGVVKIFLSKESLIQPCPDIFEECLNAKSHSHAETNILA